MRALIPSDEDLVGVNSSNSNSMDNYKLLLWKYMEFCCHGCDVHEKRICLEKISVKKSVKNGKTHYEDKDDGLYNFAVGTRRVLTDKQVAQALSEMESMGGKWKSFSKWINDNNAARVLWFVDYYKTKHSSQVGTYVMSSNNPNESDNARVKNTPEYKLTNGKGLSVHQRSPPDTLLHNRPALRYPYHNNPKHAATIQQGGEPQVSGRHAVDFKKSMNLQINSMTVGPCIGPIRTSIHPPSQSDSLLHLITIVKRWAK